MGTPSISINPLAILGGFLGQNQTDWLNGGLATIMSNLQNGNVWGSGYAQSMMNPASQASQGLLNIAPQLLFGSNGQTGDFQNLQNYLNQSFGGINPNSFTQNGLSGTAQQTLSDLYNNATSMGQGGSTMDLLKQVVAGGGGSDQSNQLWQQLSGMANGTSGNQGALGAAGQSLLTNPNSPMTSTAMQAAIQSLQNGGMTPGLQNAQQALQYIVSQGGSNSNMDQGVSAALGLLPGQSSIISQLASAANGGLQSNLGVSGLTSTGAQGETAALGGINRQGGTQNSNFLTSQGQSMAQPAVLPTLLATSLARDEATHQMQNAGEAARAQALSRGGGPGSVVANGVTNQGLADFSNQGAQGIAQAVENALQQQQSLGLQQSGLGASMASQGGNLALGNLNDYSSLLQGLENVATNRYGVSGGMLGQAQGLSTGMTGTGLSGLESLSGLQSQNVLGSLGQMQGIANSASNQAGTFGNLGLGVGGLNLNSLNTGGNLSSLLAQEMLGGNQGLQNVLSQANNYTLGAASGVNNLTGTQGGLLNNVVGGNLSGGQLGMNQAQNYYQSLLGLLGQQGNMTGQEFGMYNPALQNLGSMGNSAMGYASGGLNAQAGLLSGYNPNNMNQFGNGLANSTNGFTIKQP